MASGTKALNPKVEKLQKAETHLRSNSLLSTNSREPSSKSTTQSRPYLSLTSPCATITPQTLGSPRLITASPREKVCLANLPNCRSRMTSSVRSSLSSAPPNGSPNRPEGLDHFFCWLRAFGQTAIGHGTVSAEHRIYPLSDPAIGAGTLLTTGCRRCAFACSNWISLKCCCSRS